MTTCYSFFRMVGSIRKAVLASFVLTLSGCAPPPPPPAKVLVRVTTTRGQPVADAEVRLKSVVVARSDDTGTAHMTIGGQDGESFELRVQCPPPLRSPVRPLVVRRLDTAGREAEHSVKCEASQRTLIVAVRAEGGPDLPIMYLGREMGRTDRSGAAHVKVDADINERIELTLSTAGREMVGVHPQNPVAVFEPTAHDELREFAVNFIRDPKKKPPPAKREVGPTPF